jgi:hypothetical protein
VRRRPEKPVRRDQPLQRLVRSLEVVAVDKQRDAPRAVVVVRKHRPGETLVPQGLPEALDLPQRLRVVRTGLEVADPVAVQLLLEFRRSPPAGVLPPLVGQHLLGRVVFRYSPGKGFQHQLALLVPSHRVADDEARRVIEKRRQVDPLVAPQQESEDVRLPQLVRLRPLEARLRCRRPWPCSRLLHHPRLVQHAPHFALADPDRLEALEHVANAPRPVFGVRPLQRQHRLAPRIFLPLLLLRPRLLRKQRLVAALGHRLPPQRYRRRRQPERAAHVAQRSPRPQLLEHPHLHLQRVRPSLRMLRCLLLPRHPSPPSGSCCPPDRSGRC